MTQYDRDQRPLTSVQYSPDSTQIAVGSLAGCVNVYDTTSVSHQLSLRGHSERVTSVAWCPTQSTLLATASADFTCQLWNCSSHGETAMETDAQATSSVSSLTQFKGHQGVLSAVKFHPCGEYLATASHDYSWRLWSAQTQQLIQQGSATSSSSELLLQDGHNRELTALAFHPDGSLVSTADVSGNVLLWDLRSGQMIQLFQGHIKKVTGLDFHPLNGFQLASGSVDNMVRIWDLRKRKGSQCLPAHSHCISDLHYSLSGELLVTSSLDGSVKVWRTRDHLLLKTLSAAPATTPGALPHYIPGASVIPGTGTHATLHNHGSKVMSCDISPVDERHIVSVSYDRSIRMWAHINEY